MSRILKSALEIGYSVFQNSFMHRSSRGLGYRPFTAGTRVRISYGVPKFGSVA